MSLSNIIASSMAQLRHVKNFEAITAAKCHCRQYFTTRPSYSSSPPPFTTETLRGQSPFRIAKTYLPKGDNVKYEARLLREKNLVEHSDAFTTSRRRKRMDLDRQREDLEDRARRNLLNKKLGLTGQDYNYALRAEMAEIWRLDGNRGNAPIPKALLTVEKRSQLTMRRKFPDGWNPQKKLSRAAMDEVRQLHKYDKGIYNISTLAKTFRVSQEAIRRILRSKFSPKPGKERDVIRERKAREKQANDKLIYLDRFNEVEDLERQEILKLQERVERGEELVPESEREHEKERIL